MGFGPTQADETASVQQLLSLEATPSPLSSRPGERTGEISVWMLSLGNVFLAERSVVEGPAVFC
jgi:hypothetical protein